MCPSLEDFLNEQLDIIFSSPNDYEELITNLVRQLYSLLIIFEKYVNIEELCIKNIRIESVYRVDLNGLTYSKPHLKIIIDYKGDILVDNNIIEF